MKCGSFAILLLFYLTKISSADQTAPIQNDSILISNDTFSWLNASQSRHNLQLLDLITKHGWVIIHNIPDNESFWIGARARPTPFVSWEGCVRWTGAPGCGTSLPGGSLAACMKHCHKELHFLLLQGENCRCIPHAEMQDCFRHTEDHCDEPCKNNPNDRCGVPDMTFSLYSTGPFGPEISSAGIGKNCAVLVNKTSQRLNEKYSEVKYALESCNDSLIRRYICKNQTSVFIEDNFSFLTWMAARDKCRKRHGYMHYSFGEKKLIGTFWTSIRRSFEIVWTQSTDENLPACVSVSKMDSELTLHDEDCNKQFRYIYTSDAYSINQKAAVDGGGYIWLLSFLTIIPVGFAVWLYMYLRERNIKEDTITDDEDHYNAINPDFEMDEWQAFELKPMPPPREERLQHDRKDSGISKESRIRYFWIL